MATSGGRAGKTMTTSSWYAEPYSLWGRIGNGDVFAMEDDGGRGHNDEEGRCSNRWFPGPPVAFDTSVCHPKAAKLHLPPTDTSHRSLLTTHSQITAYDALTDHCSRHSHTAPLALRSRIIHTRGSFTPPPAPHTSQVGSNVPLMWLRIDPDLEYAVRVVWTGRQEADWTGQPEFMCKEQLEVTNVTDLDPRGGRPMGFVSCMPRAIRFGVMQSDWGHAIRLGSRAMPHDGKSLDSVVST